MSADQASSSPAAGPSGPRLSARWAEVQEALDYRFRDRGLLIQALSHPSARSETGASNQRLEFLGDAVVGLVVGQFLYTAYPEQDEGELTRLRSRIVSTGALAAWGRSLDLPSVLFLGGGLARGALPDSVLADAVEALVGAVYLEGGLDVAARVVLFGLVEQIELAVSGETRNWKSRLQELTQAEWQGTPNYVVLGSDGPDHAKVFEVAAMLGERELGRGSGNSKKEAAQRAAQQAYERLQRAARPGSDPDSDEGASADQSWIARAHAFSRRRPSAPESD